MWDGKIGSCVVSPYFFDGHINGEMFLRFIRDNLPLLLEIIPLNIRPQMRMKLDGASTYFDRRLRNELEGEMVRTRKYTELASQVSSLNKSRLFILEIYQKYCLQYTTNDTSDYKSSIEMSVSFQITKYVIQSRTLHYFEHSR